MRHLLVVLTVCLCSVAFAEAKLSHAKLLKQYEEPATWANRSNFYVGARGGIAIPQGAAGVASSAGIELGIAPDHGLGMGLNVMWMDRPPGAPVFGIQPARYGFGATGNLRYYFQTIGPLSLFPSMSVGFLAGPDASTGLNQVMPLLNPGFGAKVRVGPFYCAFDFGLSGFTIPYVGLSAGYEGDRRSDRAEAWALEREELAREHAEELDHERSAPALPAPAAPAM